MKRKPKFARSSGFALVVTLSLMILLTIIAVGLLSLSSISLRSSSQSEAMATAKSNARLALMMAIGDLQKTTGKDRAITAPSSMVAVKNPMGVTGVWDSWDKGLAPDARTSTARQNKFRQWLVSTVDGKAADKRDAPPLAVPGAPGTILLLGDGSLGDRKTIKGDDQRISLTPTRVNNNKKLSGYAWAVIDESTKARVDLFDKDPTTKQAAMMRVGAPPVDGVKALSGLEQLKPLEQDAVRLITMNTAELLPNLDPKKLRMYNPDLTVYSSSLLTSVTGGGFKKDMSVWFSKGLSSAEKTTKLYKGNNALAANYPADPVMALLESYHQYYKNIGKRSGSVVPKTDGVVAKLPARYLPTRSDPANASNLIANPTAPTEPIMVPSVLRVDVIFSMVTRDVHGGRTSGLRSAGRPYMLHLLYLPVVTLHNPYNVPLSVDGLKVTFKNVPIGFQFLVDGQPVTSSIVPLNQMYAGSQGTNAATKDFSCTLNGAAGSTASAPFVLEPGQTKLFGTPKVQPSWRWIDESPGAGADGIALFDWRNNQTADFSMSPKLMTDAKSGAGFDIDWLAPTGLQTTVGNTCGRGEGIVSLTGTEKLGVNFAPYAPPAGSGSFNINVQLRQSGSFVDAGYFSVKYQDANQLKKILEKGTSLRFPSARSFPETFPKAPADKPFGVTEIFEASTTPISAYIKPRPFVIFSVGTRTTKESFVPTRTIADGNPVMNLTNVDLSPAPSETDGTRDPIGGVPLELVMMPIRNGNAAIEDIRATEEGFGFGGSGTLYGTPRATFYELPRGPMQSLAQFRHANLAGSGFMPMSTYTAGESRAHPQIGTDVVQGVWKSDNSTMLDHTWLSNEALWDNYFLSTVADQTTPGFAKAKTYKDVMSEFFGLTTRLPNQRYRPYNPGSTSVPAALQSSATPQDVIGASMLLDGCFNVNSTSEDAWIAVLSALREFEIDTYRGVDGGVTGRTAMPRVRRPTDKNIDTQAINLRVNRWEGYRSLTDDQIKNLAKEVIVEVRKRGPFLSVADFVNRGIGSDGDDMNITGALQSAIDRLNANTLTNSDGIDLDSGMVSEHRYKSVKAATSAGSQNTATGAPGAITQGDILSGLGSHISVRSDTFRIRAYGEARDPTGKVILAKAWCEAIVQRIPAYVDPSEDPTVKQPVTTASGANAANLVFGRRYEVVSFRWLDQDEV